MADSTVSSATKSRKRKLLTLEERVDVIKRSRKGETSITISKSLNVGKTQIQNIVREQDKIIAAWENGVSADRKYFKEKKCPYEEVNVKTWEWFCEARAKNIPVSGKLIQEKALMLSVELDHSEFSASNGWLEKWRDRYNVKFAVLSGERGEVDLSVVEDWKKRLPTLCDGFLPCNIFNADESGLYYRAFPTKSLIAKGDDPGGCKVSKDRITFLLGASVTGEKIKPLVIGKSMKPRCFVGIDMLTLGVDYHNNKKAWMTGIIFSEWAKKLNHKMRVQDRKILVFVDNCSAHPPLSLSHVTFKMLPPNTTSQLQPMDAGIIQAVKMNYRKTFLRNVLIDMERDQTATGPELAKSVDLLDAVLWLKKAWRQLKPETITKCFLKCGFSQQPGKCFV